MIAEALRLDVDLPLEAVKDSLREDLEQRFLAIDQLLEEEIFRLLNFPLDFSLGLEEFELRFSDDEASEEYRRANYLLGQRKISAEEYAKVVAAYNDRRAAVFREFQPSITIKEITRIRAAIADLAKHRSISTLLQRYQQMDETLSAFEDLLYSVAVHLAEAYELGVDTARGK